MRITKDYMLDTEGEKWYALVPVKVNDEWAFFCPIYNVSDDPKFINHSINLFASLTISLNAFNVLKQLINMDEDEGEDKLSFSANNLSYLLGIYDYFKDEESFNEIVDKATGNFMRGWVVGLTYFDGLKVFTFLPEKILSKLLRERETISEHSFSESFGEPYDITEIIKKFKEGKHEN